jgi:hypothetical protein
LIAEHFLQFALVHGEEIAVFESERDAVEAGYQKYGLVPFLVKQIRPVDLPLDFTSNMLS